LRTINLSSSVVENIPQSFDRLDRSIIHGN
jgi:hypothetical protein